LKPRKKKKSQDPSQPRLQDENAEERELRLDSSEQFEELAKELKLKAFARPRQKTLVFECIDGLREKVTAGRLLLFSRLTKSAREQVGKITANKAWSFIDDVLFDLERLAHLNLENKDRKLIYELIGAVVYEISVKTLRARMKYLMDVWKLEKSSMQLEQALKKLKQKVRIDVQRHKTSLETRKKPSIGSIPSSPILIMENRSLAAPQTPPESKTDKSSKDKYRCRWEAMAEDLFQAVNYCSLRVDLHNSIEYFLRNSFRTSLARKRKKSKGDPPLLLDPVAERRLLLNKVL
jgi:hypothetical protein